MKRPTLILAVILFTAGGAFGQIFLSDSIHIEIPNPVGLSWEDQYFWVAYDGPSCCIYKVDLYGVTSPSYIRNPAQVNPGGITWDDPYIWSADYISDTSSVIYKNEGFTNISTFPINYSHSCAGVAWDDTYIYYGTNTDPAQPDTSWIYKIDPDSGFHLDSIVVPSGFINGLTHHEGHLWYSDSQADSLYKITLAGEIVESAPAPALNCTDMTVGDGSLWVVDYYTQYLYRYEFQPPPLLLSLAPLNPPVQVPAGGGSLSFDASVENTTVTYINFDFWSELVLPNSMIYPLIVRCDINVSAGACLIRQLTQYIPGSVPPENYTYIGYVGTYPDEVQDSDYFDFEKLPGDDSPNHSLGWALFGWDDGTLESGLSELPAQYGLQPPYPNPFNLETNLIFELPQGGQASLSVYDIQGREVIRLLDGWRSAGSHQVTLDGSPLPSGVYFAVLQVKGMSFTQKLMLLK